MDKLLFSLLITFFSSSLLFSTPEALVVRIPSGKMKCVTEELHSSSMTVATYRLAGDPPFPLNMSARVTNPNGDIMHSADGVEFGQFAFEAKMPGLYTACFWPSLFRLAEEISVDFDWKSGIVATKPFPSSVAKKGKIDAVEAELKKLEDSVNSIHEEMVFLREREEDVWKLYEATNSSMGTLSLLSLAICIGVAGLQLWHLKTFFEREKIL